MKAAGLGRTALTGEESKLSGRVYSEYVFGTHLFIGGAFTVLLSPRKSKMKKLKLRIQVNIKN